MPPMPAHSIIQSPQAGTIVDPVLEDEINFNIGLCHMNMGNNSDAATRFKKVDNWKSHNLYGSLMAQEANYEEGLVALNKALLNEEARTDYSAWFNAALCALHLGKKKESLDLFLGAAKVEPENEQALTAIKVNGLYDIL
jgi:tetratricopeptide (TPR) repeat protein